jgi:hypothetical protein
MAVDATGLKAEAETLLKYGEEVVHILEELDTLPYLDKFTKYVDDAQTILNKLVAFVNAA